MLGLSVALTFPEALTSLTTHSTFWSHLLNLCGSVVPTLIVHVGYTHIDLKSQYLLKWHGKPILPISESYVDSIRLKCLIMMYLSLREIIVMCYDLGSSSNRVHHIFSPNICSLSDVDGICFQWTFGYSMLLTSWMSSNWSRFIMISANGYLV